MIAIATGDTELAAKIGKHVEGKKIYILKVQDATELRHKIHSCQPSVVVLDVRLGGNAFEAMQEVPAIIKTRSEPAVIVLLPSVSAIAKKAAVEMGAFDVISRDRASWVRALRYSAVDALAARDAGLLSRPEPVAVVLH